MISTLIQYIHYNSYIISCVIIFATVTYISIKNGITYKNITILVIIASSFFFSWYFLKPKPTHLTTTNNIELSNKINPTLIQFQSEYWIACITIKPVVDRIEDRLGDKIEIIRLNINDPIGKQLSNQYKIYSIPTFIYFDNSGNEQWRSIGKLNYEKIISSINIENN